MKKLLQILFGLLLTLILAYMAFLDVSSKIKDDLLTKTKAMLSQNNVRGVTANIEGESLTISRTMVLTGTAISEVERVRIGTLTKNIEGVCHVDNQIKIHVIIAKEPTAIKTPLVKTSTEEVRVKSIPKELLNIVENTATVVEKKTTPIISVVSTKMSTENPVVKTVAKKIAKALASPSKISTEAPIVVENKTLVPLLSSTKIITKVPAVPVVVNKSIAVPIPVKAVNAPSVIKIQKIKLEGVK